MVASNDVRRLFLQAIFSRRILSQQLAAKIWEKCIAAVKGQLFKRFGYFTILFCSILTRILSFASKL